MRILIMAAGSLGGYLGGLLAKSGNEVKIIARNENLARLRGDGLVVRSVTSGDFVVDSVDVVDTLDGRWQAELVLFCVKSYQNEGAINLLKPAVAPETTILTLQNGLGSGDELAATFGSDAVMLGAAYMETERVRPGVFVEYGGTCRLVFGEQKGYKSRRSFDICNVLNKSGIHGILSDDVIVTLWEKLVFISALSGMTCICRADMVEALENSKTLDMTFQILEETSSVGRAIGVNLDSDIAQTTMQRLQKDKTELVSSMYMDLIAGRPLELANINGAVSNIGKRERIETPVNDFITMSLSVAHKRAIQGGYSGEMR